MYTMYKLNAMHMCIYFRQNTFVSINNNSTGRDLLSQCIHKQVDNTINRDSPRKTSRINHGNGCTTIVLQITQNTFTRLLLLIVADPLRLVFDVTLPPNATRAFLHFVSQVGCLLDGLDGELPALVVFKFVVVLLGDVYCFSCG